MTVPADTRPMPSRMSNLTSARPRSDGQTNTHFARPTRDRTTHDAIDAEHRECERETGEQRECHRRPGERAERRPRMPRHRLGLITMRVGSISRTVASICVAVPIRVAVRSRDDHRDRRELLGERRDDERARLFAQRADLCRTRHADDLVDDRIRPEALTDWRLSRARSDAPSLVDDGRRAARREHPRP